MAINPELQLDACNATAGWTASVEGYLSLNTTGANEGTGCLNLYLSGATTSGYGMWSRTYTATDSSKYDYLSLDFYIADSATLTAFNYLTLDAYTNASLSSGYQWKTYSNELSTGWNTLKYYYANPSLITASPDKTTLTNLTLKVHQNSAVPAGNLRLDDIELGRNIENTYDIKLDSQGYVLKPGSYTMTDLPYTMERFSTGDINYSDLMVWQYKAQTDWSGGFNNEYFASGNEFYKSRDIEINKYGSFRKTCGLTACAVSTFNGSDTEVISNTGLINNIVYYPYTDSIFFTVSNETNFSGLIYQLPNTFADACLCSTTAGVTGMTDVENYNNSIWFALGGKGLIMLSGTTFSTITQSAMFLCNYENDLYCSTIDGILKSFDGTTWTTEFSNINKYVHQMVNWKNKLYFLESEGSYLKPTDTPLKYQTICSLCSYDGVDKLNLLNWKQSFCDDQIAADNNKIYFVVNNILLSYDGENVKEEIKPMKNIYNISLNTYSFNSAENTLIGHGAGKTIKYLDNENLYSILYKEISSDCVNPIDNHTGAIIEKNQNSDWYIKYVYENSALNESFPFISAFERIPATAAQNFTLEDREIFGTPDGKILKLDNRVANTSYLESSWIDMDLFSLDKLFHSIELYVEPLPGDDNTEIPPSVNTRIQLSYKIDNAVNWSALPSHNSINGTRYEGKLPAGTYGKKIKYKVNFKANSDAIVFPYVTDIIIKYMLMPDTKKKWSIGILLANELVLEDTTREVKSGIQLQKQLWDSRTKKKALSYQDIDGTVYNVIINDMQVEGPFIDEGRISQGTSPEYHGFLELIEV